MTDLKDRGGLGEQIGRYRWWICALLFFATTVNYIDRQILSLLKPILDDELKWSNEDFANINVFFSAAYAVGLLLFGRIVDRIGSKHGYTISIAWWSLAALGHALVRSVTGFSIARVALGLGEGGNFPSAIKATAQWFPKRERALATSLFNAGSNVGPIVAPALVPWIAFNWGWHMAFVLAGLSGFLWLLFWIPFYDVPEKVRRLRVSELEHIRSDPPDLGSEKDKVGWLSVLGYRQAWSFIIAKMLTDPPWWFLLIWMPDFFKKTRHLDIKNSWVHLVTIYAIATVLSVLGGWFTGYLARRHTVTRARKTGLFIYALGVLPILLVSGAGNWEAVLLIGLAAGAHQAWSANLFTTVSDMFPKRAVASVVGLGGMAGAISNMAFTKFVGRLLDRAVASGTFKQGYALPFAICGFAYLVAFAVNHFLAPSFKPLEMRTTGQSGSQSS